MVSYRLDARLYLQLVSRMLTRMYMRRAVPRAAACAAASLRRGVKTEAHIASLGIVLPAPGRGDKIRGPAVVQTIRNCGSELSCSSNLQPAVQQSTLCARPIATEPRAYSEGDHR